MLDLTSQRYRVFEKLIAMVARDCIAALAIFTIAGSALEISSHASLCTRVAAR